MSDNEEEVAVAVVEDVVTEDAGAEGEQKGRKGGEKKEMQLLEKPEQPDYEAHEAAKADLQAQLEECQESLNKHIVELDTRTLERSNFRDKKVALQQKVAADKEKRDSLQAEWKTAQETLQGLSDQNADKRAALRGMRDQLKFHNAADLDKAVATISLKLATQTLGLDKQNKLVSALNMLKNQRPRTLQYQEAIRLAKLGAAETNALREARDTNQKKARQLNDSISPNQKLQFDLRKDELRVNNEIEKLIKLKRKENKTKFALKEQIYKLQKAFGDLEWKWRKWSDQQKYLKRMQQREADKARRAKYDADGEPVEEQEEDDDEEKVPRHPYDSELWMCEQIAGYLRAAAPKGLLEEEAKEEAAAVAEDANQLRAAGSVATALDKKKVAPMVSKKGAVDNFGGAEALAKPKTIRKRKVTVTALKHTPEVLSWFTQVSIGSPPATTAQIADTLKALKAKTDWFQAQTERQAAPKPAPAPKAAAPAKQDNNKNAKGKPASPTKAPADDAENDEVEAEARNVGRRASLTGATEEQLRRVQENAEADKANAVQEKKEKTANAKKANAASTTEQLSRVQAAAEAELANKRQEEAERTTRRKASLTMMDGEQKRRVEELRAEAAAAEAATAAERKANQAKASALAAEGRKDALATKGGDRSQKLTTALAAAEAARTKGK